MNKLFDETTTVLSKEEVVVYEHFCRKFDIDPSARLHGRQLTVTPFHYAQMMVMAARIAADEISVQLGEAVAQGKDTADVNMQSDETIDRIMQKASLALHESGTNEVAMTFAQEVNEDDEWEMAEGYELRGPLSPDHPL